MTKEIILAQLLKDKNQLNEKFGIETIALFGSYARNENSYKSDIDLLVTFNDDITDLYTLKNELKLYLHSNFNENIDICNKKFIKSFYKEQILKEAIYVF